MAAIKHILIAACLLIAHNSLLAECQLEAIAGFIQTNVAGLPVIHTKTNWPFDPDISLKRRKSWEEHNGIKGAKLIERLGLGIDGKEDERLVRQRQRDEGHLGGLNYFRP